MQAIWAVGGTYLQLDKHFNDADVVDTTTLITWNKDKSVYRCWQFGRLDSGEPVQGEGTWDAESNTLEFTCTPDPEGKVRVITYVVSGDRLTFQEGTRNEAGAVGLDLTCDWLKRK